eukprot:Nitzschia sp. Nitz4//scaffold175_size95217//32564//34132//NITZ4_004720-RA/size95217-processed-gene-0.49-mRNA-1//1//CDS//3329538930//9329//frame0
MSRMILTMKVGRSVGIRAMASWSPLATATMTSSANVSSTRSTSNLRFSRSLVQEPSWKHTSPNSFSQQKQLRYYSNTAASSTNIPFLLADIGEGIAEVELLQWFVQPGDTVQQFDLICEVQSDKATVEITSRYDGKIASLEHAVGDMVPVGKPLLFMDAEGHEHDDPSAGGSAAVEEAVPETPPAPTEPLQAPSTTPSEPEVVTPPPTMTTPGSNNKVLTTPAIRKIAKENSLDLSTITGTGPKGRILKGDVLAYLKEKDGAPAIGGSTVPSSASSVSSSTTTTASSSVTSVDQLQLPLQQDTVLELRGYTRLMVQSMTASLQIPHMVFGDEVDITALRISSLPFLPFCIKATSVALSNYPLLNSTFDSANNQLHLRKDHNIGIAMDTPRGLIVPVLKQVQDKSIEEIVQDLERLKEAARNGAVPSDDLQGATFTLSNIGAIGAGTYMSPIITSPQVAIGALGSIQRLPRFVGDSMEVQEAHIVHFSWAGDHRVIDGATMARFHKKFQSMVEDPLQLVRELK